MTALGDLLELLFTARDRFTTVEADVRSWRHLPTEAEARERWMSRQPRGSSAVLYSRHGKGGPVQPPPETEERRTRLWLRKPDAVRVESEAPGHTGPVVRTMVGGRTVTYMPRLGNEADLHETPSRGQPEPITDQPGLPVPLLDPSSLLPALAIDAISPGAHAGRAALHVAARVRPGVERGHTLPPWLSEADRLDLLVDAERGVVMRFAVYLGERAFSVVEAERIRFDGPIADAVFAFTPPPDVKVRVIPPGPGRHVRRGPSLWGRLRNRFASTPRS